MIEKDKISYKFHELCNMILSCETEEHLESMNVLIENFIIDCKLKNLDNKLVNELEDSLIGLKNSQLNLIVNI